MPVQKSKNSKRLSDLHEVVDASSMIIKQECQPDPFNKIKVKSSCLLRAPNCALNNDSELKDKVDSMEERKSEYQGSPHVAREAQLHSLLQQAEGKLIDLKREHTKKIESIKNLQEKQKSQLRFRKKDEQIKISKSVSKSSLTGMK